MEAFLGASGSVGFAGESRAEPLLRHREYGTLRRGGKGLIWACLERMTGLSRAQSARLIEKYRKTGRIAADRGRRRRFASRYTAAAAALLARVDRRPMIG